jgi:hypothetical protein
VEAVHIFEPPRMLHALSQFGYTHVPAHAMNHEPEAVSAEEQRLLTRRAQLHAIERRRRDWFDLRASLEQDVRLIASTFGREAPDEIRALRRAAERLDRRLAS